MSSIWEIKRGANPGSLGFMYFHAAKGEKYIELGPAPSALPAQAIRQIDQIGILARYLKFRVFMTTSKGDVDFVISPQIPSGYIIEPEIAAIKLVQAHLNIEVFGSFKAQYKNAWKDSDIKNKILGFVEIAAGFEPKDEQQIVWLVGTLGTMGHPFFDHGY